MNQRLTMFDSDVIDAARDLRTEDDSNPEYDRALLELTSDVTGLRRDVCKELIFGDRP